MSMPLLISRFAVSSSRDPETREACSQFSRFKNVAGLVNLESSELGVFLMGAVMDFPTVLPRKSCLLTHKRRQYLLSV